MKGDKYKVINEGEECSFRYVDEVIDHIENVVHFEVDSVALRINLKYLNKHEELSLRDDCVICRIA